jgi:hypothetical protein
MYKNPAHLSQTSPQNLVHPHNYIHMYSTPLPLPAAKPKEEKAAEYKAPQEKRRECMYGCPPPQPLQHPSLAHSPLTLNDYLADSPPEGSNPPRSWRAPFLASPFMASPVFQILQPTHEPTSDQQTHVRPINLPTNQQPHHPDVVGSDPIQPELGSSARPKSSS